MPKVYAVATATLLVLLYSVAVGSAQALPIPEDTGVPAWQVAAPETAPPAPVLPARLRPLAVPAPFAVEEMARVSAKNDAGSPLFWSFLHRSLAREVRIAFRPADLRQAGIQGVDHAGGRLFRERDGSLVWTGRILDAPGVESLGLRLGRMALPPGAQVWISGEDGSFRWIPADSKEPETVTPVVSGPRVRLGIRFPASASGSFFVTVTGFFHELPDAAAEAKSQQPWPVTPGTLRPCLIDSSCVDVARFPELRLFRKGVAFIARNDGSTCTGFLIRSYRPRQEVYFLTANHCLPDNASARRATIYWDYFTDRCGGASRVSLSGKPTARLGELLLASRERDYSLFRIGALPAGRYALPWSEESLSGAQLRSGQGMRPFILGHALGKPQSWAEVSADPPGAPPASSTSRFPCNFDREQWVVSKPIQGNALAGASGGPLLTSFGVGGLQSRHCNDVKILPKDSCQVTRANPNHIVSSWLLGILEAGNGGSPLFARP